MIYSVVENGSSICFVYLGEADNCMETIDTTENTTAFFKIACPTGYDEEDGSNSITIDTSKNLSVTVDKQTVPVTVDISEFITFGKPDLQIVTTYRVETSTISFSF